MQIISLAMDDRCKEYFGETAIAAFDGFQLVTQQNEVPTDFDSCHAYVSGPSLSER